MPKAKELVRKRFSAKSADPTDIFIEDLRGVLWNSRADLGLNWKQIAEEGRFCYETVKRFARGDTKKPQFHTIFRIMNVVGVRITYEHAQPPLHMRDNLLRRVVKGGKK